MSRNDDDGHLGHCLGFDVLVGVPLVGEGRVVGLDDVIQLLGLLALQRAVAVTQFVVDEGGQQGEGCEGGHGYRHHRGQVPGRVIKREPQHEDRHASVLDSRLDGNSNDVLAFTPAELGEEAAEAES